MAPRDRLHILVPRRAASDPFTSHTSGRDSPRPPAPIDRHAHGTGLAQATTSAAAAGLARKQATEQQVGVAPASDGVYLVFESVPGFALRLTALDPQVRGIQPELRAVQEVFVAGQPVERATVFIPDGKLSYFLKRFEEYATEDTPTGNPKHANLTERVAAVRLATIEALWTERVEDFPEPDQLTWWELWLRRRPDGAELDRLREFTQSLGIEVGDRVLRFDNRCIVLVRATPLQLGSALDLLDDLAELRSTRPTAAFFTGLARPEQTEWVDDLADRTIHAEPESPAVCVLDTGTYRQHALLEPALDDDDMHACEPAWGTHDHDGHGTEMAGLALYGNLGAALVGTGPVSLRHRLESVKVLPPPPGANEPDLYGAITADAVSRVEIQAPGRQRAFSMAVTAAAEGIAGTPTSWSAAVDAIAAGRDYDPGTSEITDLDEASIAEHRLFIVAAGNIREFDASDDHLARSDVEPVEDPAQAWNALTVGAFTELVDPGASGPPFDAWTAVAPPGELSPFSRTSVAFQRQWPAKPEIVLEGGNTARSAGGDVDWPESLQLLTTHRDPTIRQFTTTNATSAATAQAACLAADLMAEYPSFWPETVRSLVVHSARWTPAMQDQLDAAGSGKRAREALLRRYGWGVPDRQRALRSASDALTLVVQDSIHPFDSSKLREMHTHDLPWPVDALEELAEVEVSLRATLSYFIEPNPTRRGWRQRYRYASHGLRFELKAAEETNDEFLKRLNKRALDEEEGRPTSGDNSGWFLGPQARTRGSLHTDIWTGTAIELASRGRVAVFPVTGWWKEQPARDRSDLGVRYSLVLSIETPAEAADLWTPVAQQVGLPISVTT